MSFHAAHVLAAIEMSNFVARFVAGIRHVDGDYDVGLAAVGQSFHDQMLLGKGGVI